MSFMLFAALLLLAMLKLFTLSLLLLQYFKWNPWIRPVFTSLIVIIIVVVVAVGVVDKVGGYRGG